MTNLVFLKGDCLKFVVRISQSGFISCCLNYGVCPTRIARLNNLTATPKKGELLVIERLNSFLYEVKPGENFQSLCNKFGVSEDDLFICNQSRDFYPWQTVEIPKIN